LETIILDWIGRMVNLPKSFLPFSQDKLEIQNGDSTDSSQNEDEVLYDLPTGGGVILVRIFNAFFFSLAQYG